MKTKHLYKILIFKVLINLAFLCEAQNNSDCLTIENLRAFQNSSINKISADLSAKNWSKETINKNETNDYFGYNLDFIVQKWQDKSALSFRGIISFYYKNGIPNLIIYQTTNSCFKENLENNSYSHENSSYKSFVKKEGDIKIEFREYKDVTQNNRFSILVYNEASINDLIRIEKYETAIKNGDKLFKQLKFTEAIESYNIAISLLNSNEGNILAKVNENLFNCERRIAIDSAIKEGDIYYESKKFSDALNQFEIAKSKINQDEVNIQKILDTKILNCKDNITQIETKELISKAKNTADSLYNKNDYVNSKLKYEFAKNLAGNLKPQNPELIKELNKNIISCENFIQLKNLYNLLNISDQNFRKAQDMQIRREYVDALGEFEKVLNEYKEIKASYQLNPALKNNDLELRIEKSIEKTRFEIRKVSDLQITFSYSGINENDFNVFKSRNYNLLNSIVANYGKSGMLKYETILDFDYLGNNKSSLNISSFSSKNIQSGVINGIDLKSLSATKKNNYFVSSREVIDFDLKWSTTFFKANNKRSEIIFKPQNNEEYPIYQMESFINRQNFKRGIYKFEVKYKQLNNTNYTDIKLINYRNNAGPAKAFNSAIWPGWGRYKVTDGKKGKGKAWFFLIVSGITAGSKYYSNVQYNNYENASDPIEADQYYELADISNKIFLVSGGIAAFTYVHEFFWVFGKGIKNNKQTSGLKNSLKNGPVIISNSPLKPQ